MKKKKRSNNSSAKWFWEERAILCWQKAIQENVFIKRKKKEKNYLFQFKRFEKYSSMWIFIKFINVKRECNDPIVIKRGEIWKSNKTRQESLLRFDRSNQRLSSLYISDLANTKFHCAIRPIPFISRQKFTRDGNQFDSTDSIEQNEGER